jgi:hypothetical protein
MYCDVLLGNTPPVTEYTYVTRVLRMLFRVARQRSARQAASGTTTAVPRAGSGDVTKQRERLHGNAIHSLATARYNSGRNVYSWLLGNRQRNSNWFSVKRHEGYINPVTNITVQGNKQK